jgi:hypothetical protein
MHAGYAHSARRPPALPEAPEAMDVASSRVMESWEGEKEGWCERK